MALHHLAEVAGANTPFFKAFQPAGPVAARGQAPRLVVPRNDSSAVPTVNMFLAGTESVEYAASVVDACAGLTTYQIRCTSGPSYLEPTECGPNAHVVTITSGPATYRMSIATVTSTLGYDISATREENCDLQGTTQAVCRSTIGGTIGGTTATSSTTFTVSGTDYNRYNVAITEGAEKTASATAPCNPRGRNSGTRTKAVAMWGLVVGAAGVASLLAF